MLVLTRKPGERVNIGPYVSVMVTSCKGNQARLGISAPPTWQIKRHECLNQTFDHERMPNDFMMAGVIAGELQLAMAKGDWARFQVVAAGARERLTNQPASLTDMVGEFVANKLDRNGIHSLEDVAKWDPAELMHAIDGVGVVTLDRLNSALVEHLGITGWWEE